MKIINVVGEGAERRTYVDDGPRCDYFWNNGKKNVVCLTIEPDEEHREDCPGCFGTGFEAVEEWPDAVKADWLSNNIPDHFGWAIEDGYYVYTICQGEFTGERETELAENDDFSAALTAAVIAVAEGDK